MDIRKHARMKMGCLRMMMLAVGAMLLVTSTEAFAPTRTRFATTTSFTQSSKTMAIQNNRKTSSSSLTMVSPGVAVAAITGAITGGLFAGSLHAISGEYC